MGNIDIKNFCLIVFGNKKNIVKELEFVSEGPINFLDGDQMFLATFQSVLFAKDIEIILSEVKLNFILCEMIPSLFSANLGVLTDKLFAQKSNTPIFTCEDLVTEEVETKIEQDLNLDQLLDLISENGYNSLTEKQKEKLNFLSTKQ
jgi:hypothetical protein